MERGQIKGGRGGGRPVATGGRGGGVEPPPWKKLSPPSRPRLPALTFYRYRY